MNSEQLQLRHADLQQRLIAVREQGRQLDAKREENHNAEQQLLGAIAIVRELLQPAPEAPQAE